MTVEALRMLDVFVSIGAMSFDITHIHITGEKRGFRKDRPIHEVKESMPYLVPSAVSRQNNVIVRPRVPSLLCVQLDDLDEEKVRKIAAAAFLTLETSPRNYQCWVAITQAPLGTISRLRKGVGADLHASGATRLAGTYNFKPKYSPTFPLIRIVQGQPGQCVSVTRLEALGTLAPDVSAAQTFCATVANLRKPARRWPSYERCLNGAPLGANGRPHRTSVDFTWCMIAASWGHNVEATARQLLEVSSKAAENGSNYALKTAERATRAALQRIIPTGGNRHA